jgi:hypothetical protein
MSLIEVIPLNDVFRNSETLRHIRFNSKIELEIVKDIRQNYADAFDVRMIVVESNSNTKVAKKAFGYEVRRKNWATNEAQVPSSFTSRYWDDRTIYMAWSYCLASLSMCLLKSCRKAFHLDTAL